MHWSDKAPMVCHMFCYLHLSEGGLGILDIYTLQLHFLDWICIQDGKNGIFWKKDTKTLFHPWGARTQLRGRFAICLRCSFYSEVHHVLKILSWIWADLSEIRPLLREALYRMLISRDLHNDLIEVLGLTSEEFSSICPWIPRLKCLSNGETPLTWLMIRNVLWVGKMSFAVGVFFRQNVSSGVK